METIIFDFGNVLGFFDHGLSLRRLVPHTDMTAEEMYEAIIDGDLEEAYEAGRISSAEFVATVKKLCRLRCDETFIAQSWADIFRPNEDVCALVPLLKARYRILLGSNTNELHANKYKAQFADTLKYFDALVLSCEIGVRKPNAGFFAHCRQLACCPAQNCLFIDDVAANVAGARASGMEAIHYVKDLDLRKHLQDLGISL